MEEIQPDPVPRKWHIQILHELVNTPEEGNADVIVTFETGERYAATFFTLDNIHHLLNRFSTTGECVNGQYFWAVDMIIVRKLDQPTIERSIEGLLEEKLFQKAFSKLEPIAMDSADGG